MNSSNLIPYKIDDYIDSINSMNIVFYDNNCGNSLFKEIIDRLRSDKIDISVAKSSDDLNCNNATIIALDEQYNAGQETIIFAPYNNTRVGFSDSLAIAIYLGFVQEGVPVQKIQCGQRGLISSDGKSINIGPTSTEELISDGCDSSFITISFGTEKPKPDDIVTCIEAGLIRQAIYLNSDDHQTDLIYRASSEDEVSTVSDYFGTSVEKLREFNNLNSTGFEDSQTVINPYVSEMSAFSLDMTFNS